MEPEGERLDAGMKGDEGEREGRRPKEKMLYRSAAEHPFLEGLPDGWMLEAVPRGAGTKHVDHYWLVPPDRITGKTKRLRSMNEVRAFLDPEKAVYERAKRIDHEKDVIKKMLDNLIAKVEKRCGEKRSAGTGGGGPGGYRRAIPTRTAADIMRVRACARIWSGMCMCACARRREMIRTTTSLTFPTADAGRRCAGAADCVHALQPRAAHELAA